MSILTLLALSDRTTQDKYKLFCCDTNVEDNRFHKISSRLALKQKVDMS